MVHPAAHRPEELRIFGCRGVGRHPQEQGHAVVRVPDVDRFAPPRPEPVPILGRHGIEPSGGILSDGSIEPDRDGSDVFRPTGHTRQLEAVTDRQ